MDCLNEVVVREAWVQLRLQQTESVQFCQDKTVECSPGVMLGKYFAADTKCDSHTEARGLSTEDNPPESGGETGIE